MEASRVFTWVAALLLSVVGSVGGLVVASTLLTLGSRVRGTIVAALVSYAVGTLLGAALLVLVPEALSRLAPAVALGVLLGGIMTFFILEKLVLWRHCHEEEACRVHRTTATLVIIGDGVHTFVDGIVIAAATLTSVPLGVSTALALAAHEIPQEAGDFGVLLAAGYSRRRAVILNLASGLGGLAGAALMLVFGAQAPTVLPYVLAFAAGNFLYVAMADLIPSLHQGRVTTSPTRQVALIAAGIATIGLLGPG